VNVVLVIFDTLRKDCIGTYGTPPWGKVHTPHLDAFAQESLTLTRAFPESLPTLPARRAIYTGQRVYPFIEGVTRHKGDFVGVPGWGPIPENMDTLAELLGDRGGYRTGLISDVYHTFKPSKNFWRGFDQWTFLRGQETDPERSGPEPTQEEIDYWLAEEWQRPDPNRSQVQERKIGLIRQALKNMSWRKREEDYFNARVMIEAARWLEQNQDAEKFFLVVECFDPHEPWFVPEYYRRRYDDSDGREQVFSPYCDLAQMPPDLLRRARANYSGLVTMCDRWFGHLYETMRVLGVLENTVVIVTSDHGHCLGDGNYVGKRGYPSHPATVDIPLFVRHPAGIVAGMRSALLLQHTDISAQILEFAGVEPTQPLHGQPFWQRAIEGGSPIRDHVTMGWGFSVTVINGRWWLNCKVDGSGAFLYDLSAQKPFTQNAADDYPDVVRQMFAQAVADAGGQFPHTLLELAANRPDAPGCSILAAFE